MNKRNSKEKWWEHCLNSIPNGIFNPHFGANSVLKWGLSFCSLPAHFKMGSPHFKMGHLCWPGFPVTCQKTPLATNTKNWGSKERTVLSCHSMEVYDSVHQHIISLGAPSSHQIFWPILVPSHPMHILLLQCSIGGISLVQLPPVFFAVVTSSYSLIVLSSLSMTV